MHGRGAHYDEWSDYNLEKTANEIFPTDKGSHAIFVLPQGATGFWANQQSGPRWGDSVAKDLLAHIDATYRTLPQRDSRGIGGLSMGGHGALQLAMNFPETFGAIGARGPALYARENAPGFFGGPSAFHRFDPETLIRDSNSARPPHVWLDVGDKDERRPMVERVLEVVRARGWPNEWHAFTGSHNQDYWGDNMKLYFTFFIKAFAARGGGTREVLPGQKT